MILDTPGRGGEGGQKRANFCGRPLWMAPKVMTDEWFYQNILQGLNVTASNY